MCANSPLLPLFRHRRQEYNQDMNKSNLAERAGKISSAIGNPLFDSQAVREGGAAASAAIAFFSGQQPTSSTVQAQTASR